LIIAPTVRSDKIQKGMNSLEYDQNELCKQWGFRVSPQMTIADARILPAPKLAYHPVCRLHLLLLYIK